MRNVKVMIIIKSIYWSVRQQPRDKLQQALEKEKILLQKKWTNKNKDEDEYTKNVITKNYAKQSLTYHQF
jgi:hypothetical protein